jgi:tripartite-type tricarboxylate transporter receptor subunit TctC
MSRLTIGALALLSVLFPVAALAQDWPAKQPIKIIVPFTAGSATDIAGRIVFEQVGKQIGQNFVFENRGGAGTTLGAAMVAKADPDGYTLLVNSTSQVVVASTFAKLPYSVADDFVPISALADIPFVVSTTTNYKSMQDVVAASSKPGGIFYGTNGPGSSGHLFMEALRLAAGYPITHVPFRGTVEAMTEVIAGRIDMFPAPALNAINLTKEGKVNSLAVSSPKRLPLMAEVPTLAEVGLPKAQ